MYIPASFRIDDRKRLFEFIETYSFATLVTVRDEIPFATHLPLLLDADRGVLLGHFARANPHSDLIGAPTISLAIFAGPHAYISPSWYATDRAVPTWNYAAVHVYGSLRPISDGETRTLVDATVEKYESAMPTPWPNDLPDDFRAQLLRGITGFEIPIDRIEGKFKLGQNRSEADQEKMLGHLLAGGKDARELAAFIERERSRPA